VLEPRGFPLVLTSRRWYAFGFSACLAAALILVIFDVSSLDFEPKS